MPLRMLVSFHSINKVLHLALASCVSWLVLNIYNEVEALYARNRNPIVSLLALEGIKVLAESLPIIVIDPTSIDARSKAQYGAWLCGLCLGSVGMALHHKLCHTIGGSYNMPHAETHTVILPHALAYNAPKIPEVMKQLAVVLPESNGDAVYGLNVLLTRLKVKRGLKDFGFKEDDVDKAAKMAVANAYWNPRAVEEDLVRELIRRAVMGEPAKADL
jgi:alcohol dehydrogenase class IV